MKESAKGRFFENIYADFKGSDFFLIKFSLVKLSYFWFSLVLIILFQFWLKINPPHPTRHSLTKFSGDIFPRRQHFTRLFLVSSACPSLSYVWLVAH